MSVIDALTPGSALGRRAAPLPDTTIRLRLVGLVGLVGRLILRQHPDQPSADDCNVPPGQSDGPWLGNAEWGAQTFGLGARLPAATLGVTLREGWNLATCSGPGWAACSDMARSQRQGHRREAPYRTVTVPSVSRGRLVAAGLRPTSFEVPTVILTSPPAFPLTAA